MNSRVESVREGSKTGASVSRRRKRTAIKSYFARHLQTFFYTLGQMWRNPVAALMTAAVIGIALALPAGMHVVLKNVQQVLSGWDGATQISLFLTEKTTESQAQKLAANLRGRPTIASVDYISREQAMNEFKRLSGFGEALEALDSNPLPSVLVVRPTLNSNSAEEVGILVAELRSFAEVDLAQLDMEWVKRLFALMEIGKRGIWVLGALLALGVLLVVGNTIRLAILNRRDEIVIIKLVGGTDAFVRRPFLYTGFWYGVFGGIVALLLVQTSLWILSEPVRNLAALYNSSFSLDSIDFLTTLSLFSFGTGLGLIGSWIAVGRHLRDIEPT